MRESRLSAVLSSLVPVVDGLENASGSLGLLTYCPITVLSGKPADRTISNRYYQASSDFGL